MIPAKARSENDSR